MRYPDIYLASASPRRAELLTQLGVRFELLLPQVDESPLAAETLSQQVLRLAKLKAQAGWQLAQVKDPVRPVLAADTLVCCDGQILGKPKDAQQARDWLAWLSGRQQQVCTAVVVQNAQGVRWRLQQSELQFRPLSATEIDDYVATGEPLHKAGAYGIQGYAGSFVRHLSGSYSGVMGLPLADTHELLVELGSPLISLC